MTGSRHVKGIDVSVPVKREDSATIALAGGWQEIDLNGKAKTEDSGEVDLGQVRASMLSVYLRATVY
ncbi:MAG TPA: hypothetical protein PLI95_13820 [Polyangiaceae bacterium]|nr:hypothetical protein [Polyangiaceae bacterium]